MKALASVALLALAAGLAAPAAAQDAAPAAVSAPAHPMTAQGAAEFVAAAEKDLLEFSNEKNLIDWVNSTCAVGPADRVLFITSLGFDLSVYDVFGLLAAGGSIRVAVREELEDPRALARILAEEPITFWDSAPAALSQLVPFLPEAVAGGGGRVRLVRDGVDDLEGLAADRVDGPAADVVLQVRRQVRRTVRHGSSSREGQWSSDARTSSLARSR